MSSIIPPILYIIPIMYRKLILFYEIIHDVLITMTLSVSVAGKEKQNYHPERLHVLSLSDEISN